MWRHGSSLCEVAEAARTDDVKGAYDPLPLSATTYLVRITRQQLFYEVAEDAHTDIVKVPERMIRCLSRPRARIIMGKAPAPTRMSVNRKPNVPDATPVKARMML